jgi:S1-C subfamily serine protease
VEQARLHIREALVKIYTVAATPNYFSPWKMVHTQNRSGSGCIIAGKRILTNAHVVADHTFIQVRRHDHARRYTARVLEVSHEADLALLTVDDDDFFAGAPPLPLGELPATQQEVVVYGFPFGGDSLSITKGVLSRIEHQRYTHSSRSLLAGQIDAAINSGNSGGPVMVHDRVVGVVMQAYSPQYSENMGHMVPVPVIRHFLRDIADGTYDGFPALGLDTQSMVNPHMKRHYGMPLDQTGLAVQRMVYGSPATDLLQVGDVLVAIDGRAIADDGTVEFRPHERTRYTYFVEQRQLGESVRLEVLRRGVRLQVEVPLTRTQRAFALVPSEQYDRRPRYFIYGGIVFSPLTKNLLQSWGDDWQKSAPTALLAARDKHPTAAQREVVVALQVLPAALNIGYHHILSWIVAEVNGEAVQDFDTFYQRVVTSTGPALVLRNAQGAQIILDRQAAEESHARILQMYHIHADRSEDLQPPSARVVRANQ